MPITVHDGTPAFTVWPSVTTDRDTDTGYQPVSTLPDDPKYPADPRYAAVWSREMAAEGIEDLPVSWYRQTPRAALTRPHGIGNIIFMMMVTFGANLGVGYLMLASDDEVGVWQKAETPNAYSSTAVSDLLVTTLMLTLINTWTSRSSGLRALKKGWTVMVDPALMSGGFWRLVPFGLHPYLRRGFVGGFLRGLLCAAIVLICFGLPFLLLLEIICTGGGMHGHNSTCTMDKGTYVWVKACFAGLLIGLISPIIILMGISAAVLTAADRTIIIDNQRDRWKASQASKIVPTEV